MSYVPCPGKEGDIVVDLGYTEPQILGTMPGMIGALPMLLDKYTSPGYLIATLRLNRV